MEIISAEDKQALAFDNIPEGLKLIWVVSELDEVLKARRHIKNQPTLKRGNLYISSYWQHGMTEDRHKVAKRAAL